MEPVPRKTAMYLYIVVRIYMTRTAAAAFWIGFTKNVA